MMLGVDRKVGSSCLLAASRSRPALPSRRTALRAVAFKTEDQAKDMVAKIGRAEDNGVLGPPEKRTALQRHVDFFDRKKTGVIFPTDTYDGFRRIGFNAPLSFASTMVIHTSFSYPTYDGWLPDLRFPIYSANIHKCKHGSDAEVYDTDGHIAYEKVDWLLNKYDKGNKGGLDWDDIKAMTKGNRNVMDPFGWTAEYLEWLAFWGIAKDENGFVSKEKILGQYEGTVWAQLEEQNARTEGSSTLKASAPAKATVPRDSERK